MSGHALVIGAGGAVGESAVSALRAQGWRVTASMRQRRADAIERLERAGAAVAFHDLTSDAWAETARACDAVIFAVHLPITTAALARTPVAGHVVAFSSNNVAIDPHAATYRDLAIAEAQLMKTDARAAIIRPTLIYGDPRLPTMTRILQTARKWPIVPVPGWGSARMQPIFHEDLGFLAAGLVQQGASGVFAAGGPDIVPMRAMVRAAIRAAEARAFALPLPAFLLAPAAPWLARRGLLTRDQLQRADKDRVAVPCTPLPPDLAPRTRLAEGLARLAASLDAAGG